MLQPNLMSMNGQRTPTKDQVSDPLFLESTARTMLVLGAFHAAARPLSLTEVAKAAGIGRSVAQRIVHTLSVLGYISRDEVRRGYVPGIRILDHTLDYLRMNALIERASPVLLDLRRNVRERVDLSLFDDLRLVYASRLQSKRETFFATLVGHSIPIFAASGGRAILSRLTEEKVDDILSRSRLVALTEKTLTDPHMIKKHVSEARAAGFSVVTEEVLIGEIGIGVAVTGLDRRPLGAIHVAASLSEWTPEEFTARVAPLAVEAANAISYSMA